MKRLSIAHCIALLFFIPLLSKPEIALIDMRPFIHGTVQERKAVAQEFGKSLKEVGFVVVYNCGVSPTTVHNAYALSKRFFDLSEQVRMRYRMQDGHQGYVPFGIEHSIYNPENPDLKMFYQYLGSMQQDTFIPQEIDGFPHGVHALYAELFACLSFCLRATALYLGYEGGQETILSDLLVDSCMRLLYYPPIENPVSDQSFRSAPHEDLGVITAIPCPTDPGLRVLTRAGEWIDVVIPENAVVINAGDTLSRITNYVIPSTTHCVVNPTDNSARFSIPLFGEFALDTPLRVLDKCIGDTPQEQLPKEIAYGEFFTERMQAIGIKE